MANMFCNHLEFKVEIHEPINGSRDVMVVIKNVDYPEDSLILTGSDAAEIYEAILKPIVTKRES